ncbi:hypothetical protein Sjap_003927 [Stephania japonica]|uniref:Uncharacterized protein n=1 Tax=Stephania japonica TaxID=461633 RepID=A0AAP0KPQ4_9MAGN
MLRNHNQILDPTSPFNLGPKIKSVIESMILKAHLILTVPSLQSSSSLFPHQSSSQPLPLAAYFPCNIGLRTQNLPTPRPRPRPRPRPSGGGVISAELGPCLDLTEDNIKLVLEDARTQFAQIFDTSAGMTGQVELAEVDGPFVKISLSGRFWHKRSTVVARIANYLKQRIPEILEVDIQDEKQLDDSPANF